MEKKKWTLSRPGGPAAYAREAAVPGEAGAAALLGVCMVLWADFAAWQMPAWRVLAAVRAALNEPLAIAGDFRYLGYCCILGAIGYSAVRMRPQLRPKDGVRLLLVRGYLPFVCTALLFGGAAAAVGRIAGVPLRWNTLGLKNWLLDAGLFHFVLGDLASESQMDHLAWLVGLCLAAAVLAYLCALLPAQAAPAGPLAAAAVFWFVGGRLPAGGDRWQLCSLGWMLLAAAPGMLAGLLAEKKLHGAAAAAYGVLCVAAAILCQRAFLPDYTVGSTFAVSLLYASAVLAALLGLRARGVKFCPALADAARWLLYCYPLYGLLFFETAWNRKTTASYTVLFCAAALLSAVLALIHAKWEQAVIGCLRKTAPGGASTETDGNAL